MGRAWRAAHPAGPARGAQGMSPVRLPAGSACTLSRQHHGLRLALRPLAPALFAPAPLTAQASCSALRTAGPAAAAAARTRRAAPCMPRAPPWAAPRRTCGSALAASSGRWSEAPCAAAMPAATESRLAPPSGRGSRAVKEAAAAARSQHPSEQRLQCTGMTKGVLSLLL